MKYNHSLSQFYDIKHVLFIIVHEQRCLEDEEFSFLFVFSFVWDLTRLEKMKKMRRRRKNVKEKEIFGEGKYRYSLF